MRKSKIKLYGFTLIELLVVIAIIGLLASIVLVALNSARIKSRDAKRVADLKQIQAALELYYTDNSGYPAGSQCNSNVAGGCWFTILPSQYLSKMPTDPLNVSGTSGYGYYYWQGMEPTSNCTFTNTGSANNYMIQTRLENPSNVTNSCGSNITTSQNSYANYMVGQ